MTNVVTAVLFILVSCGIALRANTRLRGEDRLPMQWWIDGQVTWSAPRTVALAFVPALVLAVLVSLIVLLLNLRPRPGQEGLELPALIGLGIIFLAIQLLHVWLIEKTLRRNRS
jgi:hypothetical protein